MRRLLVVLVVVGFAVLAGAVAFFGGVGVGGIAGIGGPPGELDHRWTATLDTDFEENHHDIAVATIDGDAVLAVPVNDLTDGDGCGLVALNADGSHRWTFDIPPDHCTPHAIGDVGVVDRTGDGPEFLAGTETRELVALDAVDGTVTISHDLGQIGYSQPLAADLSGDGTPEIVAVDFGGNVHVLDDDGTLLWDVELNGTTPVDPLAADLTGDGETELSVVQRTGGTGEAVAFDGEGAELWRARFDSPARSWAAAESEYGTSPILSLGSEVVALDGSDGSRRWERELSESRVTVGGATDGRVFAAGDGTVWALNADDGTVVWEREFGSDRDGAAPVVGDATGDGDPEVAVAFRDGTVAILDPESGDVLARETVDGPLHVSPLLVDLTGDGSEEVVLLAGDARIEAYDYAGSD